MLTSRFLKWAETSPMAPALHHRGRTLTYGALREMAHDLACRLSSLGIGAGTRVAFQLPKSPETVALLLGILETGAAYVPIDPRAPVRRLLQIAGDCDPSVLVVTAAIAGALRVQAAEAGQALPQTFTLGPNSEGTARLEDIPRETGFTPRDRDRSAPAYILYTSGTTGVPKGVEISEAAACSFVSWAIDTFCITRSDHLTSVASLAFDLSIFDLFAALSTCASVSLIDPEQFLRPVELLAYLKHAAITTLYAVPSSIELLVREGQATSDELPQLRRVLYAGEPFPVKSLTTAMNALSRTKFFNLFGPTETNVCCYHELTAPPPPGALAVPIGVPCAHLNVVLRADDGTEAKDGQVGELCVAGASIMSGYFRNADATGRAFCARPNRVDASPLSDREGEIPAGSASGERTSNAGAFYRTGDFARRDEQGRYWFLGRRDRMVKRRGYRIELGEIEAVLQEHADVREAATFVEQSGDTCLICAAVVPKEGCSLSQLMLRAHVGTRLAPYQVPDRILFVEAIPRTLTGKIDFLSLSSSRTPLPP